MKVPNLFEIAFHQCPTQTAYMANAMQLFHKYNT